MSKMKYMQGTRKMSYSSQNPGKEYRKSLWCDKFVKRVDDDRDMEKRMMMMLTKIKELSELRMLFTLIEKG